ncbi:MAG: DUF4112 domain-containing protein [Symploca sp. SIO2E9]|nr:DUF4112 domain-containing protein [Symploca sp. SIO2E9]
MSNPYPQPSSDSFNAKNSTLRRLHRLSYLLDNAIPIPGTPYRVGLDPILSLLPGAGDFLASLLSVYIVIEAVRLRIPQATLVQMVGNVLLDTVVGSVPVLGDVFDVGWKANVKNVALLEKQLKVSPPRQKTNWLFLAVLLGVLIMVIIASIAISISILNWLLGALQP